MLPVLVSNYKQVEEVKKMSKKVLVGIVCSLFLFSALIPIVATTNGTTVKVNTTSVTTNKTDNISIVRSELQGGNILVSRQPIGMFSKFDEIKGCETADINPVLNGFDLEAREVYLSSKPEDWNGDYKVTDPRSGDELHIHFVYTIWGEGTVDDYYLNLRLSTQDLEHEVFDYEWHVTDPDARRGGVTYTWYLVVWYHAPGGDYNLVGVVDSRDDVDEEDEDNNEASLDFSVTPRDEKFDLEAKEIWMSSEPSDWEKKHLIEPPLIVGEEVFFHVCYEIYGNCWETTPAYAIKLNIDSGEWYIPIQEMELRKPCYIYRICFTSEEGNGWIAPEEGQYTATFHVDCNNDVKEWNTNNNKAFMEFWVGPGGNTYRPNGGDKWEYEEIPLLNRGDASASPPEEGEDKPGNMEVWTYAVLWGEAKAHAWLYYADFKPKHTKTIDVSYSGHFYIMLTGGTFDFGPFPLPSEYTLRVEGYTYIKDKTTGEYIKSRFFDYDHKLDLPIVEDYEETMKHTFIAGHSYELGLRIEAKSDARLFAASETAIVLSLDWIKIE